jgi:hypothetical protein
MHRIRLGARVTIEYTEYYPEYRIADHELCMNAEWRLRKAYQLP